MGAYVSIEQCYYRHNITVDCTNSTVSNTTDPYTIYGGIDHGKFKPNPDVAGIGILAAFFTVAGLALFVSLVYLCLQLTRFMKFTGLNVRLRYPNEVATAAGSASYRTTWADIFEGIILSCSDQQMFTSGAYALTIRYAQACEISAYHYNIVASMMLITCATHLMSVTVVSQYWKHKLLAVTRTILITGLYIVTCLLLSNTNADGKTFPSSPPPNGTDTLLVLPAACFESEHTSGLETLNDTVSHGAKHLFKDSIANSSPRNHIQGWGFFVLMVLWYGAAILAEFFRFWYRLPTRGQPRWHKGRRIADRFAERAFWVYQIVGTGFCIVAIVKSYMYIQSLRSWMDKSPWIERLDNGTNPENDATSFGQLVPILLTLLTVFTFFQLIGDKFSEHWEKWDPRKSRPDPETQGSDSSGKGQSSRNLPKPKNPAVFQTASVPLTPILELREPWHPITPLGPLSLGSPIGNNNSAPR